MAAYDIIADAIRTKKQITASYQGRYREMCPHVIGRKNGRPQALFFQFAGESKSGLPPGGEWRCIPIEQLEQVQSREGPWHTGANHSRPQTCVSEIDVEVAF